MRRLAILLLPLGACTGESAPVGGIGDACKPEVIPEGGFSDTESYVRMGERECDDACIVHRHAGDLEPDAEETEAEIERNVYCTCSCGNLVCGDLADVRCGTCPEGFECCSLGEDAECGPGVVSDWCVREGTCG